jgi:hypothetical protein
MASPISVIVEVDTFYQQFLKKQFEYDEKSDRLVFPEKSDFNKWLEFYLQPTPSDYQIEDYGDKTLRIAIPNMRSKDVYKFNYLSKNRQVAFRSFVSDYYDVVVHGIYLEHKAVSLSAVKKFEIKSFVYFLIEEFEFSFDNYERIVKDIYRYNLIESNRRNKNGEKNGKEAHKHKEDTVLSER